MRSARSEFHSSDLFSFPKEIYFLEACIIHWIRLLSDEMRSSCREPAVCQDDEILSNHRIAMRRHELLVAMEHGLLRSVLCASVMDRTTSLLVP